MFSFIEDVIEIAVGIVLTDYVVSSNAAVRQESIA